MKNVVYAFDGNSAEQIWRREFGNAVDLKKPHKIAGGNNYRDIQEHIGIIGTPVVSVQHNAIYAVSFSRVGDAYHHDLHALDLSTGAELFGGPARVKASVPGTGAGSADGVVQFESVLQNQRPALLLSRGRIYVAFASYADYGNYHGWVLAYDPSTLKQVAAANLTPHTIAGGIWQAGQGPAADDQGNVYVVSGNGPYNTESLAREPVLGETALGSPAAVALDNGKLALAWTGNEALRRLNVAFSQDGRNFGGKQILTDTSIDGPSLCYGQGRLFIAWTGPDELQRVNVMSTANLQQFEQRVTLNESGEFGPAIAYGAGRIYLAWVGREAPRRLNVMSSTDGVQWTNKVTLMDQSAAAPALSFIGGKVYLAWVGTDAKHSLNIMESTDGVTFQNKVTLPHFSDSRPALTMGGSLQLAWTGVGEDLPLMRLSGPDIHNR